MLFFALCTLYFALPAAGQSPAEAARRLEQIRRERGALSGELARSRAAGEAIAGDIQRLDRQVGTSSAVLGTLESEMGEGNDQAVRTARALLVARDRLGDRRAVLYRRLRDIYKRGPLNSTEVLLTADSFGDLINRYKYLFLIARHDRQLVREVAGLEGQLAVRERELQRTLTQLQDGQTEQSIVHDQLTDLRAQREAALAAARARERTAATRIARLEQDERSLRSLLAGLERARTTSTLATTATRAAAAPAATLTTRDLGALAWPVQGSLLYRFGRSPQANGTAIRWNGIGIGAPAGSAVRSVEGGQVVMAGPFEGYGPSVVVSHGGGYYSLYLYLQRISVKQGDTVVRNQAVGTVGGAATPEGAHLEFQIRGPGGEAVDPLAWLQKRAAS